MSPKISDQPSAVSDQPKTEDGLVLLIADS
jgi:hypothetical protein